MFCRTLAFEGLVALVVGTGRVRTPAVAGRPRRLVESEKKLNGETTFLFNHHMYKALLQQLLIMAPYNMPAISKSLLKALLMSNVVATVSIMAGYWSPQIRLPRVTQSILSSLERNDLDGRRQLT